ncbi:MAG: Glu-tRNA(Gln) amidotransferase subunit GatE [Acidobacteriota bacterium]
MGPSNALPPEAPRPPADLNPRTDPPLDFRDKPLAEMTPGDWDALGFMCGLEVHQQLRTRTKLFCRCPAGVYVDHHDAEVLRHMRPTLSELGEYDGCALMEFKTRKEIIYLLERETVCTYEMDDTPPFEIDREAVEIAYLVAAMFRLQLVPELHVMRKQYLDGSIPTGFQRTAMVGLSGEIPFRDPTLGIDRPLRIRQLSLEEDSCREVSDVGHRIVFRTDRLGMPLIETVTEPELVTPWEVRQAGRLLARVARATGRVRRGAGAARQDVNVSVAGGRRVEIKGVDNHRRLPQLVHTEAFRQLNLLRLRAEMQARGLTRDVFAIPADGPAWEVSPLVIDATSALRRSVYEPVRRALEQDHTIVAVLLRGCAGLLSRPTQPGISFAHELQGRVRVIACLTGHPFMIHSDVADYGLAAARWRHLRSALRAGRDDAIVVLWGPARDASTAAREVLARMAEALDGVPAETRQAFADGTNGFERILPGPDRMYPDTDTPPLAVPSELLPDPRALPEAPWERERRWIDAGLDPLVAARLAASDWADLFDALAPRRPETARRLAAALEKRVPYWRRRGALGRYELPAADRLAPLVAALDAGTLRPDAFEALADRAVLDPDADPAALAVPPEPAPEIATEISRAIRTVIELAPRRKRRDREALARWALGIAMRRLRGLADPRDVAARIAAGLAGEA